MKNRLCVFILGMHRSGTSALSGVLQLAGLDLGKKIMRPLEDNPKGFFENEIITLLNEKILDDLYAKWNDTLFIPENWWENEIFDKYKSQISNIIISEFESDKDILIKDPRISILLPLYLEVLQKQNIKPVFLISIRNPMEIVSSLLKRNNLSPEKTLLLCMDYLLKSEYYSRLYPRLFLYYPDFLKNPLQILNVSQKKLNLQLQLNDKNVEMIQVFLDKELRHHNSDDHFPDPEAMPGLKELFDIMSQASLRDLTDPEAEAIDKIRKRFNKQFHFYTGLPFNFNAQLLIIDEPGKKVTFNFDVKYGNNKLNADISGLSNISRLDFKPSNSRVGIEISKAEFTAEDGARLELTEMKTNAEYESDDGVLIFDTEMPQINFGFSSPSPIKNISLEINYFSFGHTTYRVGSAYHKDLIDPIFSLINEKNGNDLSTSSKITVIEKDIKRKINELNDLKSKTEKLLNENKQKEITIDSLQGKIDTIHKSWTWRMGKFLLFPFKFLHRIFIKR